jgi:hypothetical protein
MNALLLGVFQGTSTNKDPNSEYGSTDFIECGSNMDPDQKPWFLLLKEYLLSLASLPLLAPLLLLASLLLLSSLLLLAS